MKHNGFTLIELLITLVIIGLLSTIIVVNMSSLNEKSKENQYDKFKEQITTAGCSYIDSNEQKVLRESCKQAQECSISLSTLIVNGLVDAELIDPSNNKRATDEQDNIVININWKYNDGYYEKECTFSSIE